MDLKEKCDWITAKEKHRAFNGARTTHATSLQSILASYIRFTGGEIIAPDTRSSNIDSQRIFTRREHEFLDRSGFSIHDVRLWASIILETSSAIAAKTLADAAGMPNVKIVPKFLLLFFLRRSDMSAPALGITLDHIGDRLKNCHQQNNHEDEETRLAVEGAGNHISSAKLLYPTFGELESFIIFVRLTRYARETWPMALENIAEILVKLYSLLEAPSKEKKPQKFNDWCSRTSFKFNRALSLISLQCSISPMKSAIFQEKALNTIVEAMSNHEPPLEINREGYRSLIRVQLMMNKSINQKTWARLKSSAWPPWKSEKLGPDSDVGAEFGDSKAMQIIRHAQAAGYPATNWEGIASIYSGWDTDQTPTIQTRVLLSKRNAPTHSGPETTNAHGAEHLQVKFWVARVQATRTLRESWACFLEFQKIFDGESTSGGNFRKGDSTVINVYLAMLEKVNAAANLEVYDWKLADNVFPGDGKEVFADPPPSSGSLRIQRGIPTAKKLFDEMIRRKIKITSWCLKEFIDGSNNLPQVLEYMELASRGQKWSMEELENIYQTKSSGLVPQPVFYSFVRLLCRTTKNLSRGAQMELAEPCTMLGWPLDSSKPIVEAYRILHSMKITYRPLWTALFRGLTNGNARFIILSDPPLPVFIVTSIGLSLARESLKVMEEADLVPGMDDFECFCLGYEFLATQSRAGAEFPVAGSDEFVMWTRGITEGGLMLKEGPDFLSDLFRRITRVPGSNDSNRPGRLPKLLEIPTRYHLQRYIRAMGAMGDYEGIYTICVWIVSYWPELAEAAAATSQGVRAYRPLILLIRLILVGAEKQKWYRPEQDLGDVTNRIRQVIQSKPAWGFWPSDEAINKHRKYDRFM